MSRAFFFLSYSAETMLFMKGTPDAPRCGFSRTLVGLLREENITFESFDILEDQEVRQVLKDLSNWPTYPQVRFLSFFLSSWFCVAARSWRPMAEVDIGHLSAVALYH